LEGVKNGQKPTLFLFGFYQNLGRILIIHFYTTACELHGFFCIKKEKWGKDIHFKLNKMG
jgi:hypothetical protein